MTFHQIKATLTAAGLPGYAVQDQTDGTFAAFVHFDDLPAEGSNKALDAAIKGLRFEVADKGLLFFA